MARKDDRALRVGIGKAAFTPASGETDSPLAPGEFYQQGRTPWAEPFEDLNGDGLYNYPEAPEGNAGDPEPFSDLNGNGKWDGQWISGFGSGTALGVHDDVWARAVVLEKSRSRVALVSVDAVGLFYEEVQKIERLLKGSLHIDRLTVSSTHTHEASDTLGLWGPLGIDGKDPRAMAAIRRAVVTAVERATESLAEARIAGGVRRVSRLQSDGRYPYVIDEDVYALRFERIDGSGTIGTLVNWSNHPESLWSHNLYISSDFPYWTRRHLEERYGGTAVYFSGSVGGIVGPGDGSDPGPDPNDDAQVPRADGSLIVVPPWPGGSSHDGYDGRAIKSAYREYFTLLYERAERMGYLVGEAAAAAIDSGAPVPVDYLNWRSQRLFIPLDNVFLFALNAVGVFDRDTYVAGKRTNPEINGVCPEGGTACIQLEYNELAAAGTDILTREDYFELGFFDEGGAAHTTLEFLTVPGELFPEIAQGYGSYSSFLEPSADPESDPFHAQDPRIPAEPVLRDAMRAPQLRLILGLGNDELGYIVPANDFVAPTYYPVYGRGVDQYDNRGGRSHYEETVSASSKLAPVVAREATGLVTGKRPAYWRGAHGGFLDYAGRTQETPDATTRGIWVNSSDPSGFDSTRAGDSRYAGGSYSYREDTTIFVGGAYGGSIVGGFLDAQGRAQAEPNARTRGVWIDGDGDGLYAPGLDGAILLETFLLSDRI